MKKRSSAWALALFLVGCTCEERVPDLLPPAGGLQSLRAVRVGHAFALTDHETASWIDTMTGDALATALATALDAPFRLEPDAQVIWQGDVLGLRDRAGSLNESSEARAAIVQRADRLVSKLSLAPRPALISPPGALPPSIVSHLPGFSVQTSELPSLMHERAFGLRRVFFVALSEDGATRALYSRLIAWAPGGDPWLTNVVGDLEILRFEDGALIEARVFDLERETSTLRELTHAAGVPGIGADHHVALFDPPVALSALPCASCHDDDTMMSLPRADLSIDARVDSILAQRATRSRSSSRSDRNRVGQSRHRRRGSRRPL